MKDATCVMCGATFHFHPSNSSGKYCRMECAVEHRRRIANFSGLSWRKLILRVAAHSDASMMRVWSIVRTLPPEAGYVLIRDMMQEREYVTTEIQRIYTAMTDAERTSVKSEMDRMEKILHAEHSPRVDVTCVVCGRGNVRHAGKCYSCGADIIAPEIAVPMR